jgi:hypothetical protein
MAEAPAWTPVELRAAAPSVVPYTEPGMDLPGAVFLGTLSLVDPVGPSSAISLLITLAFSNASRLSSLLSNLTSPGSAQYHHYLTTVEFDAEFGAAPSVYTSLVQYLSSFGVTALATHPDRLAVSFDATPSEVSAIFHAPLGEYVTESGENYFAPTSPPELPGPLAPYIADVEGLSNYSRYLTHVGPLESLETSPGAQGTEPAAGGTVPAGVNSTLSAPSSSVSPGGSSNPFASTTVASNGFTATYDQPATLDIDGKTGTCDTQYCGDFVEAPDLQVTYNETGLFENYGFPVNATVAAILWSDGVCTSVKASCASDGFYNAYCSNLPSGDSAWDFFQPDVTSFWNYSIPTGEPMPTAYSMAETGYNYAFPAGSHGYSASCDDGGAEAENTLDVDMLGSLAPGANVFQVFGGESTTAEIDTAFTDILSPSTSDFSSDGGSDTAASVAKLENVSVVSNSWTSSGALPAAWTADLQIAAARGVTVLAATGDSGTTLEPPAEIANDTYGAVAVGGTTAAINSTTLLRGPPHLAVASAPYYGVGTGEIGWYEPAGTVDGFTSTYGGVGGVATSTAYPRASWFNASADALAVADAVRSGDYRAEPDLAAIANDTIIDLDQGSYSLNFTCWVSSACTATSKIAVGATSGSKPTVAGTYLIGTSVATPVTAGIVAAIDYALHARHQGWLGYLEPTVYAMGQKQSSGQLSLDSLYDVTTYTDGGGLVAEYEAKAGYSLATGWGVLDAGNYTQNTLTYNTTFTESGLPSGTLWTVFVTPTVGDANCTVSGTSCSNVASHSTTTTTLVFPEVYGTYVYTVSTADPDYSARGGSFDVDGGPGGITLKFALTVYSVSFTESGLPSGTAWFVNLTGGVSHAGVSGSPIGFEEANGTWGYTLGSANTSWFGPTGSFTVDGAATTETVTFTLVAFEVGFNETGLVPGTSWSVTLAGDSKSSTTDAITFSAPNGTYLYAVEPEPGYRVLPMTGPVTVAGAPLGVAITFADTTPSTLAVTPSQGPVGTSAAVSGTGFVPGSPVTLVFDSQAIGGGGCSSGSLTASGSGAFTCTLRVPSATSGTSVIATGAGGASATSSFTVTIPSLALSPEQGPLGAIVTASGHGFSVHTAIASLVFEGVAITACLSGSLVTGTIAPGGFRCAFEVPSDGHGSAVTATDVGGSFAVGSFTVTTPTLGVSPGQGPVGGVVTVTGHGFSVDTPLASLELAGVPITSCSSGSLTTGTIAPGGFSCTLKVPVGAAGATVTAADIGGETAGVAFTVTTPTLTLSPDQGPAGATVTVSGHGFSVDMPLGSLEFVGVTIGACVSGSLTTGRIAPGGFSCTMVVPGGTTGAAVTATDVGGAAVTGDFTVTTPTLAISPGAGPAGTAVTVTGHGFSVDARIASLSFDGVAVTACTLGSLITGAIAPGGFSCIFSVPSGTSGTTVQATDLGGAFATAAFTVTDLSSSAPTGLNGGRTARSPGPGELFVAPRSPYPSPSTPPLR